MVKGSDDGLNAKFAEALRLAPGGELALVWKDKAHPEMPMPDFMEFLLIAGLQGQQEATGQSVVELVAEIFPEPEDQAALVEILLEAGFIDAQHRFTDRAREFL